MKFAYHCILITVLVVGCSYTSNENDVDGIGKTTVKDVFSDLELTVAESKRLMFLHEPPGVVDTIVTPNLDGFRYLLKVEGCEFSPNSEWSVEYLEKLSVIEVNKIPNQDWE